MSDFNFNSASVQTVEKDIQPNVSKPLSLTTLGLIGETPKGPAFQPMQVSRSNFAAIFGGLNNEKLGNDLRYPLNYYANSFLKEADDLYVTRVLGLSGYNGGPAWGITATATVNGVTYNNMLVAVVRSRAEYTDASTLVRKVTNLGAATYIPAGYKLSLSVGARTLTFSMDPDSSDFIGRVLGRTATDKTTDIYVDTVFTDMLRMLIGNGAVTFSGMQSLSAPVNTATGWKTPETPWVVSQVRGNTVEKLFKMVMISDGDSANTEAKMSIENIDPVTKEFDVVIRDFNDTDDSTIQLERFSRCTMDSTSSKFIGRRMGARITGSSEMIHDAQSNYVIVELSREFSDDSFPCGFLGYSTSNGFTSSSTTQPEIMYKASYLPTDKVNRTYLGISERAYDSVASKGKGLNDDLFKFVGEGAAASKLLKGFHMDSNAINVLDSSGAVQFMAGPAAFAGAADIVTGVFKDKVARKFTFVAAGGFDGWDIYRTTRTNTDDFVSGTAAFPQSDYNAWGAALASFDNKEETPINLLATPGLNWLDHLSLVNATLELVERVRKDCLYIIDAPTASDLGPDEVTRLFNEVSIDSSYAATYFPAIQVQDTTNNALIFIAPTGEVCRAMAVTDKLNFPWFASAGTTRGLIPAAKRTRVKLRESDRDTLYAARINPIANFHDVGVDIFGQKTTQKRDSALDRINVRRLMLYSKAIVSQISRGLLFDQNDEKVASEFMKKVTPIFANIQRERGVKTFKVVQATIPEGQSRNELLFTIQIIPVSSVEYIGIEFQITPQGAVFND
jgi:hypothetical protein